LRRLVIATGQVKSSPPRARVLFVSFSRTAVAQVIDRAANVVGPLLSRIDVVTFHGFAWRVVNDFGAQYGFPPPLRILSAAERKVPGAPAGLTYDDLFPAASTLLARPAVAGYYARRYSLLICDEFQDTDDKEWAFLRTVAPRARRILLGDINQCIYADMKKIDPAARIAKALHLAGAVRIDLPLASHRDPTGVLPAAADAARQRRFDDPAIATAVRTGRIQLTRVATPNAHDVIVDLVRAERTAGHSVSVFTHTNVATAELSDALTAVGIRHEQVGLSEAYGEALNAQLALLKFALDGAVGARRALAVYVTANSKGKDAPPFALQILDGSNTPFERALRQVVTDLRNAADPVLEVDRLADLIAAAYTRIGPRRGQETWAEAANRTRRAMRRLADGWPVSAVEEEVEQERAAALVGNAQPPPRRVQVMNLHQTKGREADATLLLLQPNEFHGNESEPFPMLSRLLYVVLTRARQRAHIIVPEQVHPLWLPLIEVCDTLAEAGASP
jgi:DNA helicase-2/ATP-dependent DNA helicase PcrA